MSEGSGIPDADAAPRGDEAPVLPGDDARRQPIWPLRDLAVGLGLLVIWRCLALLKPETVAAIPFWLTVGISMVLPQLFLLAYPIWRARRSGLTDRFRWPGFKKLFIQFVISIPLVFALFVLLVIAGLAISRLSPQTSLTPDFWKRATTRPDILCVASILVMSFTLAPISEEIFFRGFVHEGLRSRMPVAAAALVQSLLFAALHTFGAAHAIAVFILGLLLTALYEWRKTLLTPMFVHAGNNFIAAVGVTLLMIANANAPVLGVGGRDHADGVLVEQVVPELGAARAGVREGDVLTELDGEPIRGFNDMSAAIRLKRPGDVVTVSLLRDGESLALDVMLEKRP